MFFCTFLTGCPGATSETEAPYAVEQVIEPKVSPWKEDQMLTQLNTRDLLRRKMSETLAYELLARPNIPQELSLIHI